MIKAIYGNTWDALTLRMLGYHHDHCHHLYIGPTDDLPHQYKRFKNTSKFVFLYEEDEPYIPEKK